MTSTISTANGTLTNPNILILISDQTRAPQHWPADWVSKNLPTLQRLMNNGLTFTNAFAPASECCPARASFITSTYPEENGVTVTTSELPPNKYINLANVLASANYPTAWKGKWHLWAPDGPWSAAAIQALNENYQMQEWNPPDAGTQLGPDSNPTLGGGTANNDGRFVNGITAQGQTPGWGESAVDFLNNQPLGSPWCLVVSLVNPHDVFLYPNYLSGTGYPASALNNLGIQLPENMNDDLSTKPSAQAAFASSFETNNPLPTQQDQLNYVNFYAYLHTVVDALFGDVLAALDKNGLTENTLIIRMADHGEMGLSHGMRQKVYNAYEETIRMPFIVSNPTLWPAAATTDALASTIDLVPTLAAIVGSSNTTTLRGVNLLPVIEGSQPYVQESVIYTFDDMFPPYPPVGHIRTIRTAQWKYSVYFNEPPQSSGTNFEYEMYDLAADPLEMNNLLYGTPDAPALAQWQILHPQLTMQLNELQAMPQNGVQWPSAPWESQ
ncbi:MAG TPA: sulfatase-like hydrolase/transferase [Thermoanaerobaculia bacterium]|nr:sulfatase-like hydrolase/transferase [Thermoanaerobaculia bacterium]